MGDESEGIRRRQIWTAHAGQHMHMHVCHWEVSSNTDIHRDDPNVWMETQFWGKEFQFHSWLTPVSFLLIVLGISLLLQMLHLVCLGEISNSAWLWFSAAQASLHVQPVERTRCYSEGRHLSNAGSKWLWSAAVIWEMTNPPSCLLQMAVLPTIKCDTSKLQQ